MPDDILTVKDPQGNMLETWESTFGVDEFPVPLGKRKAALWKKMPAAFYNWLQKMAILRLNRHDDILRQNVLWNDVQDFLMLEETSAQRPPVWGSALGMPGLVFAKATAKHEVVFWQSRAQFDIGTVRLFIAAESNTRGGVMFSVGLGAALSGPFTTYSPSEPLLFDPNDPQPQVLEIPVGTLEPGKMYYYKLTREYDHAGDTLAVPVIVTKIMAR